jgi:23S rRNA (cytosine1962-C5)-methyltransferase
MRTLKLRRNEDRRLRAGHLWVYSNEVAVAATPLSEFSPGELAVVEDHGGRALGTAYVNPGTLICARLFSRRPGAALDEAWLLRRLRTAADLRQRLFGEPCYRLLHGEGDGIPGLVVDRYGELLVVQIGTAGIERVRGELVAALARLEGVRSILLRNDLPARQLEGLPQGVEVAHGTPPEEVRVSENGVRFLVDPVGGQKTGWFYDHRMNRARLPTYAGGGRVLDLFSYLGGWGITAAVGGARVRCVDASAAALQRLRRSAEENGVADRVEAVEADAFEALAGMGAAGERFDVVVLDPPAFAKRRKDLPAAERAYRKLNRQALALLETGGVLVSASCSHHLQRDELRRIILRAAQDAGHEVQMVEEGHQGPDHPVHPAMPETAYLKAFFVRVTGRSGE